MGGALCSPFFWPSTHSEIDLEIVKKAHPGWSHFEGKRSGLRFVRTFSWLHFWGGFSFFFQDWGKYLKELGGEISKPDSDRCLFSLLFCILAVGGKYFGISRRIRAKKVETSGCVCANATPLLSTRCKKKFSRGTFLGMKAKTNGIPPPPSLLSWGRINADLV